MISIGQFDFKLNHLLIIGILSLSFSISFLLRSQPADWGWELNEFDPFFNYRATQYIVENGFDSYFEWNDHLSWYPDGRDISQTSQIMLHITTAITYWIFGGGGSLYDFTILFPVVIGSLTSVVVFALVRVLGGTTAGLFSALFFSISLPIIVRGQIGWFKSEPLGLFFGVLAIYLFLSGLKSKNQKIALSKILSSGVFLTFGLSAWGGNQFFIIPLGIFILALPFIRSDYRFLLWTIPTFTFSSILTSLMFERLIIKFVTGLGGMSLIIPTIFLVFCIIIQMKSNPKHKTRNGLIFLVAILIIGPSMLMINADSEFISLPSFRYLNAINPLFTTSDPLVDSVSEHATTSINQSFLFHSVLMIFAGIGIWLILRSKQTKSIDNDMIFFSLIIGIIGVYISSAFVRLEVFASLAIVIFASFGLSLLSKEMFSEKNKINKIKPFAVKSSFVFGIMFLLISPLTFPANSTIFTITDNPPTILNGGSTHKISSNDWNDSLEWIKNNTDKDAVVASWWDYGYWIQTKAERATLADNSTLETITIEKIAEIFLSSPNDGWKSLNDMGVDYFVIFVAGERQSLVSNDNQPLYTLRNGGDESKKQWFIRIADQPLTKFLHSDGISGTDYFWNETLMGKMIPFNLIVYIHPQVNEQSLSYQPGFIPLYEKEIKYSDDGNYPLKLVYSSPSFNREDIGPLIGVFVYEINKDYIPAN